MQGDVSVSPPNLDLMATVSNHGKRQDMKPTFSGALKETMSLEIFNLWKELSGFWGSALRSTARTDLLYVKAKQMETKTAMLTSGAWRSPCMN